ncbi:hypothetical protein KSD_42980 [Ktedonobacter sp. SOSP1-85]|nr:hypothetical protein KSD_42980 [Ktedonobacter sp. SOSP1-85]
MVKLDEDGVTDFARQSTIAFMLLQAMKESGIGEVGSLMDEGLSNLIIGLIIQVFGGKGGLINDGKGFSVLPGEG